MGIKHYLMAKHLLSMSGNKLYEDEVEVTFAELYAMLLDSPGFVVLVYNDRAYHPTLVKGPTSGDSKWRVSFSSPIIDGVTTKTAEIECESSDGQVISKITTTAVNSENVSNKTDDIANNADDSTKYPSTKGVADYLDGNYLPLTGGTLSGELRVNNGGIVTEEYASISGAPAYTGGGNALFSAYDSNTDRRNRRILSLYSNTSDIERALMLFTQTDGQFDRGYRLYGEHNFPIDAGGSSHDMDTYMRASYGLNFYRYDVNTLGTPYKQASIGKGEYGVILSYVTSPYAGKQICFPTSMENVYVRYKHDGVISDWVELGGVGMRVPIATGQGKISTHSQYGSQTFTINGKGTIWVNLGDNNNATMKFTVDGVDLVNAVAGKITPSGSEYFPFDFEKSVTGTWSNPSGNVYTLYYFYELYK